MIAATRINWRKIPSRHPRMISRRIRRTANETKTSCQAEEPAMFWISGCGLRIAERKRDISISDFGYRIAERKRDGAALSFRNPVSEIRDCNRSLAQSVITENERGHRFDDWHGAR